MTDVPHRMAAHCESGTVSTLLEAAGVSLSEAMVFGLAGAVCFVYLDSKDLAFPTVAFRNQPGTIWGNVQKTLGVDFHATTFRSPEAGKAALDRLLDEGQRVAAQVDFFYMDYIPPYARAHFNAHFVTILARRPGEYLVADSYAPKPEWLSEKSLQRARFARGRFAPKGLLLHLDGPAPAPDLEKATREGLRGAMTRMVRLPLPFLGVRGIRRFGQKVLEWPQLATSPEQLSHELMMVYVAIEERGTGGGGFRYLFATFLQEAAERLARPELAELAPKMMENGDKWREISLAAARLGRRGPVDAAGLQGLSELILARADAEDTLFRTVGKALG